MMDHRGAQATGNDAGDARRYPMVRMIHEATNLKQIEANWSNSTWSNLSYSNWGFFWEHLIVLETFISNRKKLPYGGSYIVITLIKMLFLPELCHIVWFPVGEWEHQQAVLEIQQQWATQSQWWPYSETLTPTVLVHVGFTWIYYVKPLLQVLKNSMIKWIVAAKKLSWFDSCSIQNVVNLLGVPGSY